jgi:DhnA family fructose-bisphosphate aldolase class Ia
MLRAVRPRVALCAGSDATKAVKAVKVVWQMKVIAAPHFIYWGLEREQQMAQEINDYLSSLGSSTSITA